MLTSPENLEQRTKKYEQYYKAIPHTLACISVYLTELQSSNRDRIIFKDESTGRYYPFKRVEDDKYILTMGSYIQKGKGDDI